MQTIYLSKDQIIESIGTDRFEKITELEILFTTFDEIASLNNFSNLRKLSCIDNGLKRISNLEPVSISLITLCLCDQNLKIMDNLLLPNLKDLYLHRNDIRHIGNLNGCPKLRKLWLFQNKIETISNLHSLPEIEELWLQSNNITKLNGFENNIMLKNIELAGNPIIDFKELKRLSQCPVLRTLSLSDIHFGRCPIVDENGYKEFILVHMKQIVMLDGVQVAKDAFLQAEDVYYAQLKSFNASLQEVHDAYRGDLKTIESLYQSKESHSVTLEKEMSAALKELQGLVNEGRSVINKQITQNHNLLFSNTTTLSKQLSQLESQATEALKHNLDLIHNEFDISASLLYILDQVATADHEILTMLTEVTSNMNINHAKQLLQSSSSSTASASSSSSSTSFNQVKIDATNTMNYQKIYFQNVSNNSADHQFIADLMNPAKNSSNSSINNNNNHVDEGVSTKNYNKNNTSSSSSSSSRNNSQGFEIAKLYRIVIQPIPPPSSSMLPPSSSMLSSSSSMHASIAFQEKSITLPYERVFTIVTIDMLKTILQHGWAGLSESGASSSSGSSSSKNISCQVPVFSTDLDLLASLYDSIGVLMTPSIPEQYLNITRHHDEINSSKSNDDDYDVLVNLLNKQLSPTIAGSSYNNTNKTNSSGSYGKTTTTPLVKLQEAINSKLYMVLWFYIDKVSSSSDSKTTTTTNITNMTLPSEVHTRNELMQEFQKIKKFQKIQFSFTFPVTSIKQSSSSSSSKEQRPSSLLYLLPSIQCHESIFIDFISLCVTPPVSNGGLRTIDYRLEPLLLPTNQVDNTSHLLNTYEKQSAQEIHKFIDNILEEIDDKYAIILKNHEQDISNREVSMKNTREEVEKERKNQEFYLKDLRQTQEGISTMTHSNSNVNINNNNYHHNQQQQSQQQQQQQQINQVRSNSNSGSNNSRR